MYRRCFKIIPNNQKLSKIIIWQLLYLCWVVMVLFGFEMAGKARFWSLGLILNCLAPLIKDLVQFHWFLKAGCYEICVVLLSCLGPYKYSFDFVNIIQCEIYKPKEKTSHSLNCENMICFLGHLVFYLRTTIYLFDTYFVLN